MASILIIDDSLPLLELFPLILENKGHSVNTSSDPADIGRQISLHNPDIILLDVRMGSSDGRKICASIKKEHATKDIRIILLSGSPELLLNYTDCAADDVIEKPFDIDTVTEKIAAFTSGGIPNIPQKEK